MERCVAGEQHREVLKGSRYTSKHWCQQKRDLQLFWWAVSIQPLKTYQHINKTPSCTVSFLKMT